MDSTSPEQKPLLSSKNILGRVSNGLRSIMSGRDKPPTPQEMRSNEPPPGNTVDKPAESRPLSPEEEILRDSIKVNVDTLLDKVKASKIPRNYLYSETFNIMDPSYGASVRKVVDDHDHGINTPIPDRPLESQAATFNLSTQDQTDLTTLGLNGNQIQIQVFHNPDRTYAATKDRALIHLPERSAVFITAGDQTVGMQIHAGDPQRTTLEINKNPLDPNKETLSAIRSFLQRADQLVQ